MSGVHLSASLSVSKIIQKELDGLAFSEIWKKGQVNIKKTVKL